MQSLLKVENLQKSYKNKQVIHGISFDVFEGEILGFLGPNGAGKSTTIRILTGALGFEHGAIAWKGQDVSRRMKAFKQQLGIVPQELALYEDISAMRNVRFFASLYGLKGRALESRCEAALSFVGLADKAGHKVKTFSGGMKRRLNIACAIAHKPALLILDEPTVGIDPQSRNHILQSIKRLRAEGATILYTTHYMEEVEEIATRILIMDEGHIIAEGTNESLKEGIQSERCFEISVSGTASLQRDDLCAVEGVKEAILEDGRIKVTSAKGVENLDRIIAYLQRAQVNITDITCRTASLETVFLQLTGKSLRD